MCYRPLYGWLGRDANPATGKRPVVFELSKGFHDRPMVVPCGQCIGCRLERSRQWAVRCMHEASLHDANCLLTLTYDPEHMPAYGSLDKNAFPLFMKRLRKGLPPKSVRYFHCGEYGDRRGRPHYHALLFGYDFPDKYVWRQRGEYPVWRSDSLERLWPFGQSEIGTVTFESAAYVARYVMKKVTGKDSDVAYAFCDEDGVVQQLEAEYTTMSRRPGIGAEWFRRFGGEVYPADRVIVRGKAAKPPRFYDGMYELVDPEGMDGVRCSRRLRVDRDEQRGVRLAAREEVAAARQRTFGKRGLE